MVIVLPREKSPVLQEPGAAGDSFAPAERGTAAGKVVSMASY